MDLKVVQWLIWMHFSKKKQFYQVKFDFDWSRHPDTRNNHHWVCFVSMQKLLTYKNMSAEKISINILSSYISILFHCTLYFLVLPFRNSPFCDLPSNGFNVQWSKWWLSAYLPTNNTELISLNSVILAINPLLLRMWHWLFISTGWSSLRTFARVWSRASRRRLCFGYKQQRQSSKFQKCTRHCCGICKVYSKGRFRFPRKPRRWNCHNMLKKKVTAKIIELSVWFWYCSPIPVICIGKTKTVRNQ